MNNILFEIKFRIKVEISIITKKKKKFYFIPHLIKKQIFTKIQGNQDD